MIESKMEKVKNSQDVTVKNLSEQLHKLREVSAEMEKKAREAQEAKLLLEKNIEDEKKLFVEQGVRYAQENHLLKQEIQELDKKLVSALEEKNALMIELQKTRLDRDRFMLAVLLIAVGGLAVFPLIFQPHKNGPRPANFQEKIIVSLPAPEKPDKSSFDTQVPAPSVPQPKQALPQASQSPVLSIPASSIVKTTGNGGNFMGGKYNK